jgi:hypothetical protein
MTTRLSLIAALTASLWSVEPAAADQISLTYVPRSGEDALGVKLGLRLYMQGLGGEHVQSGGNRAAVDQVGSGNTATIVQQGAGHYGRITQRGRHNAHALYQFGRNTTKHVVQTGRGQSGITVVYGN